MSILFEAWRRARGNGDSVARTLGAPSDERIQRRVILPWVLSALFAALAAGLAVYLWRSHSPAGNRVRLPVLRQHVSKASFVQGGQASSALQSMRKSTVGTAVTPRRELAPHAPSATSGAGVHRVTAKGKTPEATRTDSTSTLPAAGGTVGEYSSPVRHRASPMLGGVALRQALPPFTVTVHVWNRDPSARFIIVGGNTYREGDMIAPGVHLVRITRDGEIVRFRGQRISVGGS